MFKNYLSLIKFSHTVFALPFAVFGFLLALFYSDARNVLTQFEILKLLILVLLCMVFARSAAMAFNRFIDRRIDADNERTKSREIPAGVISAQSALLFVILTSVCFIICTWFINPMCFYLSPIALLTVLGYSYTKRFTAFCHLILGLGLGLAPIGAYLSIAGSFDTNSNIAWLLSGVVFCWVSGFDIIYALQDEQFDRKLGLNSIPETYGAFKALKISELAHGICAILLIAVGIMAALGTFFWVGSIIFIGLLIYQHTLVKPNDLSKINLAFFTTNGIASIILSVFASLDMYF